MGWLFVAPFIVVFAVAIVAPIGYALYLSLFRMQLIGGNTFIGIQNYLEVLTDAKFWQSVGRVLAYFFIQVPVMLALSVAAALALDSGRLRGVAFYRVLLFLPYAVPGVVATLVWGFMYGKQFGLVGNLDRLLGITLPNPLSSGWLLFSIANIATWSFVGFNMLIYYSALKSIPTDLYEAAELDGAGAWWTIFAIKLPALRSSFVVTLMFAVIGSAQLFSEPTVLKSNAPNVINTFFTPNIYAYNLSFFGQETNYAAAVAIVMGAITMVVAYLVQVAGERGRRS